jgi:hypothetical protein
MPAKDIFHDIVKTALQKDGWLITDDPFKLNYHSKCRRTVMFINNSRIKS